MIELFRRGGNVKESKKFIDRAEKKTPNLNDPGLCYCRGLYYKYL